MKSALRKLIAFVFLLGIVWYIYRDIDNVWSNSFMISVALLVVAFAVFWAVVPVVVVWLRIRGRRRRNLGLYAEWKARLGPEGPAPIRRNARLNIDRAEQVYYHEKGTFYVNAGVGFDAASVPGRIGDVAFPKERRQWRKVQRVHCYFTDRRILFLGRELDCDLALVEVRRCHDAPGGLVFEAGDEGRPLRVAFTFRNPLAAAEIFGFISSKAARSL